MAKKKTLLSRTCWQDTARGIIALTSFRIGSAFCFGSAFCCSGLASPSTAKDRVITALSAQPHNFFRKGARKLTKFMKIMNVGSVIPVFWSFWTWTTTTCTHGAAEFQLISILWLNFGYIYWNTFKLLDVHVRLEYLDQVGMLVFQRIVGPTWIHQAPAVEVSCKHVPLTRPPYQRPQLMANVFSLVSWDKVLVKLFGYGCTFKSAQSTSILWYTPNLARSLTYLNPKIGLLFGTSMFRLWISKVFSYHPADDAFEGVKWYHM